MFAFTVGATIIGTCYCHPMQLWSSGIQWLWEDHAAVLYPGSTQVGKWTHQCPRSAARVPRTPRTRQGCGIHATGGGNGDWSCMLCFHVSMLAIVNTQWWDQYRPAGCMCCLQYENSTMHVIRHCSGAYSLELQQSIH